MDFLDLHKLTDKSQLQSGVMLIAEPFLSDSIFSRSVIYLCEYNEEGSIGFVLNQPTDLAISDLFPDVYNEDMLIGQGGPVQLDTLHMLHDMEDVLGGKEISKGVYWGGSFDTILEQNLLSEIDLKKIRLFVGYSGWSAGQLEKEMEEGTWLISKPINKLVFQQANDEIWKEAIATLGKEYKYLQNLPINPQLN